MSVAVYTSFTFAYLGRARILAKTVKRFHPDWHVVAVITDLPPHQMTFNLDEEPFDQVIWFFDLDIDNKLSWIFSHTIVEACTAVKGYALVQLLAEGFDKVFYLDPDIAVFNSLKPLEEIHDHAAISLTPHQLCPEENDFGIVDNEIGSLKFGTFNLGYVGVSNTDTGRAFANWWADRLSHHCFDDVPNGLFTDQRWCDLVPSYFSDVQIVRDPGYNVASWNISERRVEFDKSGNLTSNGYPLRFVHFTKMGPLGRRMTQRYGWHSPAYFELWNWYETFHNSVEPKDLPHRYWYYGYYQNSAPISDDDRRLYRQRLDLQQHFPDPFRCDSDSFLSWLRAQTSTAVQTDSDSSNE